MYVVQMMKCPHCGCPFDINLFAVSTRLGPEVATCAKCKQTLQTDRLEWSQVKGKKLLRFLSIATLEVGGLAAIFASLTLSVYYHWKGVDRKFDPINLDSQSLVAMSSGAALAVVILVYKVHRSKLREGSPPVPSNESLLFNGVTFGTQFKILLILLIPNGIIWLMGWI